MRRPSKAVESVAIVCARMLATWQAFVVFCCIAVFGGFYVNWHDPFMISQWVSQTFIQLVALSAIGILSRVLSESSDQQAKEMHDGVMEELAIAKAERDELKDMHKELHALLKKGV
jgi:hypothetical protein